MSPAQVGRTQETDQPRPSSRIQPKCHHAKLEKHIFDQATMEFLGYIISPKGIQMDTQKLVILPMPQLNKTWLFLIWSASKEDPLAQGTQSMPLGTKMHLSVKYGIKYFDEHIHVPQSTGGTIAVP